MTRAAEALAGLRLRLAAASDSPALDAEILLAQVLGLTRAGLAARPERVLTGGEVQALRTLEARRLAGEPVAYLVGRRGFRDLELAVTRDVLVPRPETELVVDLALAALPRGEPAAVLDLGTGSGAIALAIARERPQAEVTAVDASAAALAVARGNAARLGIGNVRFLAGAWYGPVAGRRFRAIVANPPYLADADPALAALAFEPRAALVAGTTGLEALAAIAGGAPRHLAPGGALVLEHGAGQGAAVRALLARAGLAGIRTHRDLAGHERATAGTVAAQPLQSAPVPEQ